MAMSEWWYQEMGERHGPFSESQMRALANRGVIDAHTPVFCSSGSTWRTALAAGLVDDRSAGQPRPASRVPVAEQTAAPHPLDVPVRRGVPLREAMAARRRGVDAYQAMAVAPAVAMPGKSIVLLLGNVACHAAALGCWMPWCRLPGGDEINGFGFSITWPAWSIVCLSIAGGWTARFSPSRVVAGGALVFPSLGSIAVAAWMVHRLRFVMAAHAAVSGQRAVEASGAGLSFGLFVVIAAGVVACLAGWRVLAGPRDL